MFLLHFTCITLKALNQRRICNCALSRKRGDISNRQGILELSCNDLVFLVDNITVLRQVFFLNIHGCHNGKVKDLPLGKTEASNDAYTFSCKEYLLNLSISTFIGNHHRWVTSAVGKAS